MTKRTLQGKWEDDFGRQPLSQRGPYPPRREQNRKRSLEHTFNVVIYSLLLVIASVTIAAIILLVMGYRHIF